MKTKNNCDKLDGWIRSYNRPTSKSKWRKKRGQEYCILFYSEKKENYLQNIGYLGEQLDFILYLKT